MQEIPGRKNFEAIRERENKNFPFNIPAKALDYGQCYVGFGNHCTHKSLSVPCALTRKAEDNSGRRAMGMSHHQLATELEMIPF